MSKTIAIANHKGGVGKTTTTANLGAILADQGKRVLLVDLDAQANLTSTLMRGEPQQTIYNALRDRAALPTMEVRPNLYLIPSTLDLAGVELEMAGQLRREFALKDLLAPLAPGYDYIILDCAPSLGLLTINAFAAANEVIIAMEAQPMAFKGLGKTEQFMEMCRKALNPALRLSGILFTKWERCKMSNTIEEAVRAAFGDVVFATKIRKNIALAEAALKNMDIVSFDPKSNGAADYAAFAAEFMERENNPNSVS